MSFEFWKGAFDLAAVVLLLLTFVAGAGALYTGRVLSKRQNAAIGQANDRATQADLKRIALQTRMLDVFGPRQLTNEQQMRIANRLSGLKNADVDVYVLAVNGPYAAGDFKDSEDIGLAIVHTLRSASINAEGWLLEDCQGSSASNVVVTVRPPASEYSRSIGQQIIGALQPEIETYPELSLIPPICNKFSPLDKSNPNKGRHGASVSITIGRKINPLLTREMLEPVGGK